MPWYEYDVAIVGAGVGGLVAGCYLQRAGLKVTIVEQNDHPGGCSTSFSRDGFTFDVGVRGVVGCSERGPLGKVIAELELEKEVTLARSSIFDIIQTDDWKIPLSHSALETEELLKQTFPEEAANIRIFFELLKKDNFFEVYAKWSSRTYADLINSYFKNPHLKHFWNMLRADTGLAPDKTSALAGFILAKGYIVDGGYYPKGGMQALADGLARRFRSFGGELVLSANVQKILVKQRAVRGIMTGNEELLARYVISNCDATQTYLKLIGGENLPWGFARRIQKMAPSVSAFIVYLGLSKKLQGTIDKCCAIWYSPSYMDDQDYDVVYTKKLDYNLKSIVCIFPSFQDPNMAPPNGECIYMYVAAPFESEAFWKANREPFTDNMISRAEALIPKLRESIALQESATPHAIHRWTGNRDGATRGWACTPSQTIANLISEQGVLQNLYMAGHWTTSAVGQGGIAMAAFSGRKAARLLLKEMGLPWK